MSDPLDALMAQHGATVAAPQPAGGDLDALMQSHGAMAPDFKQSDTSPNELDPNTIGTFVRHWWSSVNPVQIGQLLPFPKSLGGSGLDNPINPVNIVKQMQAVKQDADARWAKGDKVGATAKYIESVIPVFGPAMSHWGDQLESGHYAAGAGDMAGFTTAIAAPELAAKAKATVPLPFSAAKNLTADEAASNAFAAERGVPLDAATATGSKFLRAAEKRVSNTMGGEGTADALINRQQQSLARVGGELADEARGAPSTPETAGQGIKDALASKVDAHHALARQAYQTVEDAASAKKITVPTTTAKQMLTPLYKSLQREAQLTPGAVMGSKATVLNAIDRLMGAGDALPLMDAENVLSSLKELSRSKEGQLDAMRTPGQAAAGQAVKTLQQAIDTAAIRGGVLKDLQTGRAATAAKFETHTALEALSGDEPVGFFRQVTRPKDASIDLLRSVTKQAPQIAPQIARGYLEDLLGQATERGRFDHADKLYADWQKLGSETKQVLFPQPGQRQALDHFFLLAKRVAENPNPSGTAHTLTALNVGSQPLAYVLAKLLYKPRGVQTLTRGLTLSLAGNRTAAALQFTRAADLLREGALDTAVPLAAGADQAPGTDRRAGTPR